MVTIIPISTPQDLNNIRRNLSGNYYLTNDIDLRKISWEPIGSEDAPFTGTIDGRGFSIKNLTVLPSATLMLARTYEYVYHSAIGFIDSLGASFEIRNLTFENAHIEDSGGRSVALLGELIVSTDEQVSFVIENVRIKNCTIRNRLYATSALIAYINVESLLDSVIKNVYVDNCTIDGGDFGSNIGGLIGYFYAYDSWGLTIESCRITNSRLVGKGYVGGIVGYMYAENVHNIAIHITKSYTTGKIISYDTGAGIINYASVPINNSFASVPVSNYDEFPIIIDNCYSLVDIEASYGACGITTLSGHLINCYYAGLLSSEAYTFGIAPNSSPDRIRATSCYYDADKSNANMPEYDVGTAKTTEEMKQQATFVDWDFIKIWRITERQTYPHFGMTPSFGTKAIPLLLRSRRRTL